ncbi:MAG TPA: WD40 repeat domain-containing protein [Bryobacteraceae bacterium]|nr:WD40 repeat domain-containing protein [Bryobacteraceae bacterium]
MIRALVFLAALPLLGQSDRTISVDEVPGGIFFSADGKTLVTACRDNQVRVFDVLTGKQVRARRYGAGGALLGANRLVERSDKKGVQVWDLTQERLLQLVEGVPVRGRSALSSDGKLMAAADTDSREVQIYDLTSGKRRYVLPDGIGGASQLLFSPDGASLVSANFDNDIRIWKTRSGELVRKIENMTGAMFAAQFTPDGKQLLVAGLDETIYVLDGVTFEKLRAYKGHGETIAALAVSPDGKTIVTGGFDVSAISKPVKVVFWDVVSGKVLKTVPAPHRVVSLAFSPDNQWVAVTAGDKEISLLRVR